MRIVSFLGSMALVSSVFSYSYFDEFFKIQQDMLKSFDKEFNTLNFKYPSMNIYDKKDKYEIDVELSGINKKDIKIVLHDNILIISGKKEYKKENKDDKVIKQEAFFGSFSRSISLPEDSDLESINTKFENGILKIFIQKIKNYKNKKYKVIKID